MNDAVKRLDVPGAEARLMRYLQVEGVTGHEGAIAGAIVEELKSLGVAESAIRFDGANERIPLPTETKFSNGRLDANWLVNHGMPTVSFGAG